MLIFDDAYELFKMRRSPLPLRDTPKEITDIIENRCIKHFMMPCALAVIGTAQTHGKFHDEEITAACFIIFIEICSILRCFDRKMT